VKPPAPADRGWSGCAVVAGDSNEDLPGAHRECVAVADKLGAAPIIGDACTVEAVRDALTTAPTDRLDVVQLRPVSKEYPGRAVTGEQQAAAAPRRASARPCTARCAWDVLRRQPIPSQ
jgi:hypothetical protein